MTYDNAEGTSSTFLFNEVIRCFLFRDTKYLCFCLLQVSLRPVPKALTVFSPSFCKRSDIVTVSLS